ITGRMPGGVPDGVTGVETTGQVPGGATRRQVTATASTRAGRARDLARVLGGILCGRVDSVDVRVEVVLTDAVGEAVVRLVGVALQLRHELAAHGTVAFEPVADRAAVRADVDPVPVLIAQAALPAALHRGVAAESGAGVEALAVDLLGLLVGLL